MEPLLIVHLRRNADAALGIGRRISFQHVLLRRDVRQSPG